MDNIFESVKSQVGIVDLLDRYGIQLDTNHKANCPFHNEKTGSFSVDVERNYFKCFGCGESGDIIDFVSKYKDIEKLDAAKLIAEMYNINVGNAQGAKPTVKDYIERCRKDIGMTDYFTKRGLTSSTIKKFCLGYDSYRKAVTIPYSSKKQYYQSRSTIDKSFYKPRTEDAGAEPLFNCDALKSKGKTPIFVVESPICAMSIMQCGSVAISTCGTSGWRKVLAEIKKTSDINGLVLCFDNDEPGRKAAADMVNELNKKQIKYVPYNIAGKCKDPNELLVTNEKQLKINIKSAIKEFRDKYATDKDSFSAEDLFNEKLEPTEWIVENMLPTGLAMLCAPSKFGKSWMVLQLCNCIASGNTFLNHKTKDCECLYYALEDSKARLQNRLGKMLKDKRPSSKVHMTIKSDTIANGLLDKIREELQTFPNIKLVIIDTLQKVRGKMDKNSTLYANEYNEMGAIKEFADKNKICILLVHHLRKMADDSDVFNMISGSTALMGAADTIIILSKKKRGDEQATLSATGRDISASDLVVSFDKVAYKWKVDGTAEDISESREREEYENNVYVQTIKELIKREPMGGWSGSASDLMKAVYDVLGKQVVDTTSSVGKQISRFEHKLYCDDIQHTASKSNNRKHTFRKIIREKYCSYQRTIYDVKDD